MKAPHTTLQKDTFEFIMTDQQTAEPHPHTAQLREAPSDLLADLRAKIDVIDAKLSALIVERLAIADEIGERKRGRNLPIHAPKREEALLEKLAETRAAQRAADCRCGLRTFDRGLPPAAARRTALR